VPPIVAPGCIHKVRELRRAISVAGEKADGQPQRIRKSLRETVHTAFTVEQ